MAEQIAVIRTCSVEGCDGKHVGRGFCRKHYDASRWANDPERRQALREADKRYRKSLKGKAATRRCNQRQKTTVE